MCSPISRRSAPATGTPALLSARITASNAAPRLRTSTRISPALQTRPASSPLLVQSRTVFAIREARRTGGECRSGSSTGSAHASGCRSSRGSTVGHSSTRPGALVRALSWVVPTAESSKDRPLKWSGSAKVLSTAESTAFAERKESVRRTSWKRNAALSVRAFQYRRLVSNSRGAAPWKPKIDCFGSPTAKTVRICRARAPLPAEKSSVMWRRICHCSGFVSCASSTST